MLDLRLKAVENLSAGLDLFKVAKILKTEKHPNADRLKVCDVDVGEKEIKKVVCGAPNAREGIDYSICSSWSHCS
jgi:phenylalanyl-tRNA synthetase beta chain